jgi:hypothetical protein
MEVASTPRRPAEATRGSGQVAGRRHCGDLQAGPGSPGPIKEPLVLLEDQLGFQT